MYGNRRRAGQEGFTLIEILIGMGMVGMFVLLLGGFLATSQRLQAEAHTQMQVQRAGYAALERLQEQIALAGLHLPPGAEAFPALPPAAGSDWTHALALQYGSEGGTPTRYAYYVEGGRLMELAGEGPAVPVTIDGSDVKGLYFTYYGDTDILLPSNRMGHPLWRASIRRVGVRLVLGRETGPVEAEYELETAVTPQNAK
jgi:type II secretory pathway pseudopilin PulG